MVAKGIEVTTREITIYVGITWDCEYANYICGENMEQIAILDYNINCINDSDFAFSKSESLYSGTNTGSITNRTTTYDTLTGNVSITIYNYDDLPFNLTGRSIEIGFSGDVGGNAAKTYDKSDQCWQSTGNMVRYYIYNRPITATSTNWKLGPNDDILNIVIDIA